MSATAFELPGSLESSQHQPVCGEFIVVAPLDTTATIAVARAHAAARAEKPTRYLHVLVLRFRLWAVVHVPQST